MTETHIPIEENTERPPVTLFEKVRHAHRHSKGPLELLQQLWIILTTSCGYLVLITLVLVAEILPIVMIVIGAYFKNDCPVQPYIPIYLIVAGVFGAIEALGCTRICLSDTKKKGEGEGEEEDGEDSRTKKSNICYSCYHTWSGLFAFCWFIAGNVWVYGTSPVFNDANSEKYCDHVLYTFAFWAVTLPYIILGIIFIVLPMWACCVACGYACCAACCRRSSA